MGFKRAGAIALLLLPAAVGDEEDIPALVRRLGDPSFEAREKAQETLLGFGERAWKDLEPALKSPDPEVGVRAQRILDAWGWVPPQSRALLTPQALAALRGRDPVARDAAVETLLRADEGALEAATALFAHPDEPEITLEPASPAGDPRPGEAMEIGFRLTNKGRIPGWAVIPKMPPTEMRGFGRCTEVGWVSTGRAGSTGCMPRDSGRGFRLSDLLWLRPGEAYEAVRKITPARPGILRILLEDVAAGFWVNPEVVEVHAWHPRVRAVEIAVPPPPSRWGAASKKGARASARLKGDRIEFNVAGGEIGVPKGFESAWYLILDDRGRILRHGALDGRTEAATASKEEDLRRLSEGESLTREFPLPFPMPPGKVRLLAGIVVHDGSENTGLTLSPSEPLPELDLVASPLEIQTP